MRIKDVMFAGLALGWVVTVGCGDDTSGGGGSAQGGEAAVGGEAATGGGGAAALDPHYACVEANLIEARKLSGPGFDAEQGGFLGATSASYVVSTTQIYVPKEKQGPFLGLATAVSTQLEATDGLVAYALGYDSGCEVNRTLSVWESEEKMYAFVGSDAHLEAMSQTTDVSVTGRVTHWTATAEEVEALDWDVARAKLDLVEPSNVYP